MPRQNAFGSLPPAPFPRLMMVRLIELLKVGRRNKHCDSAKPPSDRSLPFLSFGDSPWTASISLLVSKPQASVLSLFDWEIEPFVAVAGRGLAPAAGSGEAPTRGSAGDALSRPAPE